jgi:release factor glutamine methyltransferase
MQNKFARPGRSDENCGVIFTVLDVLRGAADYLDQRGVESPRLNAELLLAHVLGVSRMALYLDFDRPLSEGERAPMRELVKKRGGGLPMQHILGEVEFCGRSFLCDGRALIPRPETEQLLELLAVRWDGKGSALDVGTGSGVIAVTLAMEYPDARVSATDLSADALELARENAARIGAGVSFHHADILPEGSGTFALIVANLPYVPAGELVSLAREVGHDPRMALDGGPDGMEITRRLVAAAPARMVPGGLLALEIGAGQSKHLATALGENNFRDIEALPDYQGLLRFLIARYG